MKIFNLKHQTGENTSPNNRLPLVAGVGYDGVLSKSHSGQASRYSLAFFVSEVWLAPQVTQSHDTTHLPPFTGVNRHTHAHSVTSYGGVTLQNKPIGEYAGRFLTRPRVNPATLLRNFRNNVVLTQNLLGVAING